MRRTTLLAIPVAAFALVAWASAAAAAPGGALKDAGAAESLVHRTHGCHRSCELGPALGWHRHVGLGCRPVACYPRAPYPNRCWVDGWGVRHCRW